MSSNSKTVPNWIRRVKRHQLDDFIDWVDSTGGFEQPGFDAIQRAFVYVPETKVDQTLDPFSDAYYEQMLELYTELSSRTLDQATGEMTHFDIPSHLAHPNPYGSNNVQLMSGHVKAITAAINHANLPDNAHILDLGCGWGLTSEVMNFCGSQVTAVDINPDFVNLVQQRATRLQNGIHAIQSNFDDLSFTQKYDGAMFYECLHHALKPWETLEQVAGLIKPDGKIFFAGEPINALWWKNWGLRLDAGSVYCIRKNGWFESGWSADFLHQMFLRMGWKLALHPGEGLGGSDVGTACRAEFTPHGSSTAELANAAPLPTLGSEIDALRLALEEAQRQRDHARNYPWKYVGNAWRRHRERSKLS